jgi:hypothetical protein
MNRLEDRLRDAFRADADTVRPEAIPGVPVRPARRAPAWRRSRRARILIPLAAAAAVIAVVVSVGLIAPASKGPSPASTVRGLPLPVLGRGGHPASQGVPASASSPGVPQYYITYTVNSLIQTQYNAGAPTAPTTPFEPNTLDVRATATGKVTGVIEPPQGTDFGPIAATAGDRTFITELTAFPPPGNGCATTSQLYQFQLNARGVPGPLTPLNITVPGLNSQAGTLAITPDGSTIAYDSGLSCQNGFEVGVINLATGHVGTWDVPEAYHVVRLDGRSIDADVTPDTMGLSLSPDGSQLVYETQDGRAYVLQTNAPPGSLIARSQMVSGTADWAAIGDDGTELYTCSATLNGVPKPLVVPYGSLTYYAQSLAGGPKRIIADWHNLQTPECWVSPDPSGSYLLVQYPVLAPSCCSDYVQPAVLNLSTGRLRLIAAPSYWTVMDMAW